MHRIFYFVNEAIRGFFQAKRMTSISILMIGTSLFIMVSIMVAWLNIRLLTVKAGSQPDMVIYIDDNAYADSVKLSSILTVLRSRKEVKTLKLINKDDARKRFSETYGSDLLEAIDENPLPASIEVYITEKFKSGKSAQSLRVEFEKIYGVETVQYSKEWMDVVEKFRRYFYVGAAFLVITLLLALIIMISNTIRLTIYARKELIQNMQFVGATDLFIKIPFIIEGIIQGLFGALISIGFFYLIKTIAIKSPIYWGPEYMPYAIIVMGVTFGCIGSISAVRKFLS